MTGTVSPPPSAPAPSQAPPFVPTHAAHPGRTPREAAADRRRGRLLVWLPLLLLGVGGLAALLAVGPSPARPRMAAAAPLPQLDTTAPAPLTWESGADGSAGGMLHVRPGFGIGSGGLAHPGPAPAADLDAELAAAPGIAAHEPAPPAQYGLAELAPVTALDHHLTLEPTLLDRDGMLATWGRRPLTADADFGTPLLDGRMDAAAALAELDAGLAAGTPLMDAVANFRPARLWQPPSAPARPDLPPRTAVSRPAPLAWPALGAASGPPAAGGISQAEFEALWGTATAPPPVPAAPTGSLSDAEYARMLQAAQAPPRDLEGWDSLQASLGGLHAQYDVRAADPAYRPFAADSAATRRLFCGMAGADTLMSGFARMSGGVNWCDGATNTGTP